jgi:hypothetical protein
MADQTGERKVKGNDPVTVVFITDGKTFKKGQEMTVHKIQAEKFVESGKAEIKGAAKKAAPAGKEK